MMSERVMMKVFSVLKSRTSTAGFSGVIIVDNNCTDNTKLVVEETAAGGDIPVVYLRETRQGKSFALNAGLAHARGDIVALTDDDVLPTPEWLTRIVRAFRERDVTFVFGKVLPRGR